MTITAQHLADRYAMMPGLITVDYYVRSGSAGWATAASVPNVEKRNPVIQDLQYDQTWISSELTIFHVWDSQLSSITPRAGDKITYNSVSWIVKMIHRELLDKRHKLFCIRAK